MGAMNDFKEVGNDIKEEFAGLKKDVIESASDIKTGTDDTVKQVKQVAKDKLPGKIGSEPNS